MDNNSTEKKPLKPYSPVVKIIGSLAVVGVLVLATAVMDSSHIITNKTVAQYSAATSETLADAGEAADTPTAETMSAEPSEPVETAAPVEPAKPAATVAPTVAPTEKPVRTPAATAVPVVSTPTPTNIPQNYGKNNQTAQGNQQNYGGYTKEQYEAAMKAWEQELAAQQQQYQYQQSQQQSQNQQTSQQQPSSSQQTQTSTGNQNQGSSQQTDKYRQKAQEIANSNMSEYEKMKACADYVGKNSAGYNDCGGDSQNLSNMLNECGIQNGGANVHELQKNSGYTQEDTGNMGLGDNHMWNTATLSDGTTYEIDASGGDGYVMSDANDTIWGYSGAMN